MPPPIIPRLHAPPNEVGLSRTAPSQLLLWGNIVVNFTLILQVDALRLEMRAVDVGAWFTACAERG
jgi:hypothetical protein